MHDRSVRHELEFHAAPDLEWRLIARTYAIADLDALRSQNVPLLSIFVIDQGDESGSIGIILNGGDFRRHFLFIPFEVDHAEHLLMRSALMAASDVPAMVASMDASVSSPERLRGWLFSRSEFKQSRLHFLALAGSYRSKCLRHK